MTNEQGRIDYLTGTVEDLKRACEARDKEIERLTRELDALKRTREQEKDYADTCYENERLRAALQEIADSHECPELPQMARDALRGAHEPIARGVEEKLHERVGFGE